RGLCRRGVEVRLANVPAHVWLALESAGLGKLFETIDLEEPTRAPAPRMLPAGMRHATSPPATMGFKTTTYFPEKSHDPSFLVSPPVRRQVPRPAAPPGPVPAGPGGAGGPHRPQHLHRDEHQ